MRRSAPRAEMKGSHQSWGGFLRFLLSPSMEREAGSARGARAAKVSPPDLAMRRPGFHPCGRFARHGRGPTIGAMVTTPDSPDTLRERSLREEALVSAHLHLVRVLVAEMANRVPRHVFRDDLTSAAMSALAVAARHFDPARGVAFDRYAVRRMRGALLDELRAHDWASRSVR